MPIGEDPLPQNKPAPKHDRAIAMVLWVLIGLLGGYAIALFTGRGWLFLGLGLVVGVLLAITRTRPPDTE